MPLLLAAVLVLPQHFCASPPLRAPCRVREAAWEGKLDTSHASNPATVRMSKRAIELNNGRAAQMGILGLMMHEVVNGGTNPYIFG